jgi:glycosyltransferase involved in cell wall biosynthesis
MPLTGHDEITTVIPLYLDSGLPIEKFQKCIESISKQTLKPVEIIISDDSTKVDFSQEIKNFMEKISIPYRYIFFPEADGIGSNSNNGLKKVKSKYVHILHADDQLINFQVYEKMLKVLIEENRDWVIAGSLIEERSHFPRYNNFLILGENSLGGPSAMFAKTESYLQYDPIFHMMVDVDQYVRISLKCGAPALILEPLIVCGVGDWQVQKKLSESEVFTEISLLKNKHPLIWNQMKLSSELNLDQRILILKIEKKEHSSGFFSINIRILVLLALKVQKKVFFFFRRKFYFLSIF